MNRLPATSMDYSGLYRNLPVSQSLLTEDSPTYIGALFQRVENRNIEPLKDLAERIRKEPIGESAEKNLASQEPWAEVTRTSAAAHGYGWTEGGGK